MDEGGGGDGGIRLEVPCRLRQQRLRRVELCHSPVVQHQHPVTVQDGVEAVGDRQTGGTLELFA